MAHPHHEHRAHKHEKARVAHITKGYAHGGGIHHSDAAEDEHLVKRMVRKSALKTEAQAPKHRQDRAHRAKGGRVKHKGATVNVIVAPQGGAHPMVPPPGLGQAALPIKPPMPAPGPAAPPPGMAGPGPMMPHHDGGRAYAKGGRVKDGPAWKEGIRNGTQVQHSDGKKDGNDIGRGKVITYATGGPVEHPVHGGMAPHLPSGSGGGEARLFKEKRAARKYHAAAHEVNGAR